MLFLILVYSAAVQAAYRVRLAGGHQYTVMYASPLGILLLSHDQEGRAQALSCEISFHALCVYWFILVFSQNLSLYCQKAMSPLHLCLKKKDENRFFFLIFWVWHSWRSKQSSVLARVCVLFTFAFRGLGLGFLWGSEAQRFAQRARPRHADRLNMYDVVRLLLQVP